MSLVWNKVHAPRKNTWKLMNVPARLFQTLEYLANALDLATTLVYIKSVTKLRDVAKFILFYLLNRKLVLGKNVMDSQKILCHKVKSPMYHLYTIKLKDQTRKY